MARKAMPEKVEETKVKIISASLNLIVEEGFSSFTLSNVANRVGMAKPSIYWYFSSKEELISAMTTFLKATFIGDVQRISLLNISFKQKIQEMIASMENRETHNKCFLLMKVFMELHSFDHKIKAMIQQGYLEYIKILQGMFEKAIFNGEIKTAVSAPALAKIFLATLDGCTIQDEILGSTHVVYKEVQMFYETFFTTA